MADLSDIRGMSGADLEGEIRDTRKKIFDLRMKLQTDAGALREYRAAKKHLARLLTVRSEQQKAEQA
ncbi:MAG: 50S ribosomal protein L29 [Candidatus Dadabacteria bacterium]|nr:MAG: 50S ribosomal protein L29 [Candidatus Dadabacteria bacterium]